MKQLKNLLHLLFVTGFGASIALANPTDFETEITQHLVRLEGDKLTEVSAESLGSKEYYAIYFSAQWCPPCRAFTPKLVDFYKEAIGHHDNFELIFISGDRSESAMKEYMSDYGMTFLARAFDERRSSPAIKSLQGSGIPQLVVVDKHGKVIADSFKNGDYIGPYEPLKELQAKLHE